MNTGPIPDENSQGFFQGAFELGEGDYRIDWMMRDPAGLVCSQFWTIKAALPPKLADTALTLPPGAVRGEDPDLFADEPPAQKTEALPSVKVLLNYAPVDAAAADFRSWDKAALLSILRNISRDPKIGAISLTVFNLEQRRLLYRQPPSDRIDFPALGNGVQSLTPGAIEAKALTQSGPDFLHDLLNSEPEGSPGAVIFVGPPGATEQPSNELLSVLRNLKAPVFYMNYNPDPVASPWADVIARSVQSSQGKRYTIHQPRDLLAAWPDIVSRITARGEPQ
jgi:hypothetical protein